MQEGSTGTRYRRGKPLKAAVRIKLDNSSFYAKVLDGQRFKHGKVVFSASGKELVLKIDAEDRKSASVIEGAIRKQIRVVAQASKLAGNDK